MACNGTPYKFVRSCTWLQYELPFCADSILEEEVSGSSRIVYVQQLGRCLSVRLAELRRIIIIVGRHVRTTVGGAANSLRRRFAATRGASSTSKRCKLLCSMYLWSVTAVVIATAEARKGKQVGEGVCRGLN